MLNESLTSSDVQMAFEFSSSLHFVSEATKRDITESMNAIRMSCLQLMEILIGSFDLPQLEDRKKLEDFCLGHSRVIICTPYSSRLLQLKLTRFDTLLVDDASQMKESDLFIPLSMAPKHVVLLGDHLHLQPTVKSEVYI
jgi:senataxin